MDDIPTVSKSILHKIDERSRGSKWHVFVHVGTLVQGSKAAKS